MLATDIKAAKELGVDFYVIDVVGGYEENLFCFNPVNLSDDGEVESVIVGLNFLSTEPPDGSCFLGAVHSGGDNDVAEAWANDHAEILADLRERYSLERALLGDD